MTAGVLFGSFGLLLLLSVPIGIALGVASLIALIYSGTLPVEFIVQGLVTSVDSFPIMAVPFFILAGEIMGKGGITNRLFNVANTLVGNKTGGFAIATVITCMFFAAMSGSGPATVAAIGGIMIPAMVSIGYDKKFATALIAAAGSLGVILPPSIPLIMYGTTGGSSVGDLFLAGIIPGIFVGFGLMVFAYFYSRKNGYHGTGIPFDFNTFVRASWEAKWALFIPIIILGGIYGGIFTPTEAAAVAVIYALITGMFLYKEIKIKDLPKVMVDASLTTATVLLIVGAATSFGILLTIEQIPEQVTEAMLALSENPIIIVIIITLLLLIVGTFMDTVAAIIILTPILLPVVSELGFDPIHFGILMVVNLAIGFITPPLGVNLFVASGISGLSIESLSRAIIPFFVVMLITLLVITFVPQLSLMFLE
ncbi:C4-dicarboxylate transporter DctM subunit [Geomicrobium halophilum]|uniref:C4-dicarboxylate transporter DctM subunit n=1 Tax=Geomicrobium halophilum TaxID=549000 RepID=A0A841PRU2_9BACL|nr:TRAP transporter large permease [Geomicrobium halophilum]MBB6450524.1 C4-dicarboxylate transporter DctM subunit [Geomicrobium halophilum]